MTNPVLLTPDDVERIYGLPVRWQSKRRLHGGFAKYVKCGHLIRYRVSDVEAWLAANERTGTRNSAPQTAA